MCAQLTEAADRLRLTVREAVQTDEYRLVTVINSVKGGIVLLGSHKAIEGAVVASAYTLEKGKKKLVVKQPYLHLFSDEAIICSQNKNEIQPNTIVGKVTINGNTEMAILSPTKMKLNNPGVFFPRPFSSVLKYLSVIFHPQPIPPTGCLNFRRSAFTSVGNT
jgi:hypothetical protein